jgi:hypothetical protein
MSVLASSIHQATPSSPISEASNTPMWDAVEEALRAQEWRYEVKDVDSPGRKIVHAGVGGKCCWMPMTAPNADKLSDTHQRSHVNHSFNLRSRLTFWDLSSLSTLQATMERTGTLSTPMTPNAKFQFTLSRM